jgi:hypothetical protein
VSLQPRDGSASTNEKAFGAQSPALPYSIDGSVCFASLATHLQLPDVCLVRDRLTMPPP